MDQIETLLYRGGVAAIGTFRCPPEHTRFSGGSVHSHLAVFPRTTVIIERERVGPIVADPNTIVFYEPGDEYQRRGVDSRGDHCDYFAVAPEVAEEIIGVESLGSGHAPADLYLAQRAVVTAVDGDGGSDPVGVEEAILSLFARATRQVTERPTPDKTRSRHSAIVRKARRVIAERATTRVTLSEIADEVAVSPFHLARLFRRHTGFTIHRFLTQLRLRRSLDFLTSPNVDLATLALELGFSSHSHFTNVFRTEFGATPSAYRRAGPSAVADLSKILTA